MNHMNIDKLISGSNKNVLNISDMDLTELPQGIFDYEGIEYLILDGNYFEELPEEILRLKNLRLISAVNNLISKLPETIGGLANLERLYLSGNRLNRLPNDIGALSKLRKLILDSNLLSSIPDSIGELSSITQIDLRYNDLDYIPETLESLTTLNENYLSPSYARGFRIDGNNIKIGKEILSLGTQDIIGEIISIQRAKKSGKLRKANEGKIIFIGESGYGKTSLIEMLINGEITRDIKTTLGIERNSISFSYGESSIKANVWDLGGQEFMRSTHQFFFTEATLYVLVTLARREKSEINYWLRLVKMLGNNAPVLVVINQIDRDDHDIDRGSLIREYSNIIGFVKTSIHQDETIKELSSKIEIAFLDPTTMEGVHQERSEDWFKIKDTLEKIDKEFISYQEYVDICRSINNSITQKESDIWLKVFRALGIVISFFDDVRLRDTNVINPDWLMDGVYGIINDTQIKDRLTGEFYYSDLDRILSFDRYPTTKYPYLTDLMEKFQVCYKVSNNPNKFIMPDLMEDVEPPKSFSGPPVLSYRIDYGSFDCSSIVTNLIVRFNQSIMNNLVWRSGAYFTIDNNQIRMSTPYAENAIDIEIFGSEITARDVLSIFRREITVINSKFEDISQKELIRYRNVFMEYDRLLIHERDNMPYYDIQLREQIDVRILLNCYVPSETRQKEIREMAKGDTHITHSNVIINNAPNYGEQINRITNKLQESKLDPERSERVIRLTKLIEDAVLIDEPLKKMALAEIETTITASEERRLKARNSLTLWLAPLSQGLAANVIGDLISKALGVG